MNIARTKSTPSTSAPTGRDSHLAVLVSPLLTNTRLPANSSPDGKVRIWSTESIYNSAIPDTKKKKKSTSPSTPDTNPSSTTTTPPEKHQLCSMSTHNGAVTVVRFSPCGRYLASGSDDRVVLIWELDETRAPARVEFGQQQSEQNSETWVARKRLIGHENDVQDLAWAPDSSILVTVGLDSGIIIWSGTTFDKIKRFDSHQSHVKGVSFDPANKYFATASDDRTVRIIRYHHHAAQNEVMFSVEATITAPFRGSPLSTYYRRCSWSPDGNHIAAANATNGPVTTVTIINRGTWDSDISLVGHDAPCEVASFCPRIFSLEKIDSAKKRSEKKDQEEQQPQYTNLITVIATAGQDKTLAIWNTSNPRPLLVARNVAEKSITDITWSADGSKLFASSLDGSILVAVFEPGELGWIVPIEENEVQLTRYGGGKEALQIPSSTGVLQLEDAVQRSPDEEKNRILDNIMGSNPSNTSNSFDGNKKGADAKDTPATPTTTAQKKQTPIQTITTQQSSTKSPSTATAAVSTPPPAAAPSPAPPAPAAAPVAAAPQKVTITKEGKRRIAPMLISSSSSISSVGTRPAPAARQTQQQSRGTPGVVDYAPPSNSLPQGGISALIIGTKRKQDPFEEDDARRANGGAAQNGAAGAATGTANGSAAAAGSTTGSAAGAGSSKSTGTAGANGHAHGPPGTKKQRPFSEVQYLRPPIFSPASSLAQVRLAAPKVRTFFARTTSFDKSVVLEVRNSAKDTEPTKVVATRDGGTLLFCDFLPRYAMLAAGAGDKFWAVATEDGSIYVYSPQGRRLLPALVVGAALSFLESADKYLMAVSSVGLVYVWDVDARRAKHAPVSLAPVLDTSTRFAEDGLLRAPKITHAAVSYEGRVAVSLSNGESFLYDTEMGVWERVSEAWWASGSQYWDSTRAIGASETLSGGAATPRVGNGTYPVAGIVGVLENRTNEEILMSHGGSNGNGSGSSSGGRGQFLQKMVRNRMLKEGYEHFERAVSTAHLETRIAAALAAQSGAEYRQYTKMYAERLASEGLAGKLDELCSDLLGPMATPGAEDGTSATGAWQQHVCGGSVDRHALLRDVVVGVGAHRGVQKVVAKYAMAAGVIRDFDMM